MTGVGVDRLLPAVRQAHEVWNKRIPTGELNRWFEHALETHQAPLVQGRRLKLRYVTQAKARPPTFVVFGTRAEQTPEDYTRYLVNSLRDTFKLPGTPIRLQLRGTKNPFVEKTKASRPRMRPTCDPAQGHDGHAPVPPAPVPAAALAASSPLAAT